MPDTNVMGLITVDPKPIAIVGGDTTVKFLFHACNCIEDNDICLGGLYQNIKVSGASAANGSVIWTHTGPNCFSEASYGTCDSNVTTLTPTYRVNFCHGYNRDTDTLTMIVVSNNSCFPQKDSASFSIKYQFITVGIETINLSSNTSVSPNPFSKQLSIETDKPSFIKITTISGTEVYNAKVNEGKSFIDTNGFSTGSYFITITNEQTTVTKKLVKE